MRVEDIIIHDYAVANPLQNIDLFREVLLNGKFVVVKEQDVFLGILTLRDLIEKPLQRVLDVISEKPFVRSSDDVSRVLTYMLENDYEYLPVRNEKEFVGIISFKKLISATLPLSCRKNEGELRKELALKNKFLSVIGHDIKNMFNQVLGSLELLDRKLVSYQDDKSHAILKLARHSAEQVNATFDGMLLWARLGTEQLPFTPELLSLKNHYSKIISQFQLAGNVKGISICNKLESELSIYADRNMLDCILLNLVYNAIKYTPHGGEIWLDAKAMDDTTELVVVDSGLGMTLKQRDSLFTGGHPTAGTLNEIGTGIGLIICKEFVEKHLGKIVIESEQGKGTRVIVSIPNSYFVLR